MFTKRIKSLLLAMGAFAMMTSAALASDGTEVVITGGALSISNPAAADFTGVTLDGTNKQTTASLAAFSVTDARGSGAGWHVTAQANQFEGSAHNLGTSSLTLSQPTVSSSTTTSPDPSISTGPYTIDAGSAVQIASAAEDEGMGVYDFSATTLTLSIPSSTFAETYSSTVTISAVTGP